MRYWVFGSEWGKRISWTLISALLLPLLLMAMPAKHAMAQAARLPQVAVLDFGVLPAVKASGILGRSATDAVVIEMTRVGRYDVTPRATVNTQLADLGLTTPLDNIGIQKLGQNLGTDYVATGDITSVQFMENPRRARVTISVRLTDVITGELANGAIETGISPAPAPGFQADDEKLLSDAIQNAAFNAVRTITSYTLPTATIIQSRDNTEVILNRGARDGIETGLEMVVFRGTDRIGRVRVTDVRATDSTAAILDIGKGIRPEDKARAIFKLPGFVVNDDGTVKQSPIKDIESYKPRKKSNKSILNVLLGVAAAVIIATVLFDKKSRSNGSGLSSVNARSYVEGSDPTSSDAAARVEVSWDPAPDIPINNVIEYHIYRDGAIIAVATQTQRRYIDSSATDGFQVSYNAIQFGGAVNTATTGTATAGTTTTGTTTTGTTTNGTTTNGNTGNTNGNTNGNTGGNTPDQPVSIGLRTATIPAFTVGVQHRYSVTILFRQVVAQGNIAGSQTTTGNTTGGGTGGLTSGGTTGGGTGGLTTTGGGTTGSTTGNTGNTNGNGGNILYKETPLLKDSGVVTPIGRPVTTGPTGDQNLARVPVTFTTVRGANQYVVEFATSPTFADKKILSLRNGTAQPFYQNVAGGTSVTVEFNLTTDSTFNNLAGGSRIFLRVGARNLSDTPGPVKASEKGTPNGDNYIYSVEERSFTKLSTPPPPP